MLRTEGACPSSVALSGFISVGRAPIGGIMEQQRVHTAQESGQIIAEYVVVVSMITIAIVVVFILMGNTAANIITQAASAL